jgi:hypothetical protein
MKTANFSDTRKSCEGCAGQDVEMALAEVANTTEFIGGISGPKPDTRETSGTLGALGTFPTLRARCRRWLTSLGIF